VFEQQVDRLGPVCSADGGGDLAGGLRGRGQGRSDFALQCQNRSGRLLASLDSGRVVSADSLAQLLDVGMLAGRALVAVDGQPLLDAPPLQVELLAQRFHDQFLKIAAQEQQLVLIGSDHHVLAALASSSR
jgi:hypothetical protein